MSRQWKPGDVALVTWIEDGPCSLESTEVAQFLGTEWSWAGGAIDLAWVTNARPLVVIDPDDREQVERLLRAYNEVRPGVRVIEKMQAALREYADPKPPKPPKPEEPTGLGAVVEDAEGKRHVRRPVYGNESNAWCDEIGCGRPWARVDAVRVLSEGVTE